MPLPSRQPEREETPHLHHLLPTIGAIEAAGSRGQRCCCRRRQGRRRHGFLLRPYVGRHGCRNRCEHRYFGLLLHILALSSLGAFLIKCPSLVPVRPYSQPSAAAPFPRSPPLTWAGRRSPYIESRAWAGGPGSGPLTWERAP